MIITVLCSAIWYSFINYSIFNIPALEAIWETNDTRKGIEGGEGSSKTRKRRYNATVAKKW
jgi:hypothetical protein